MTVAGYGIDFGTTNSAISIAYDDAVEVVELEAESSLPTMLPSMVYLHRDSLRLAGTQSGETFMVTGRERHKCAACPLVYLTNGEADTNCRTYFRGGGCMDSRLLAGLKLDLADESFFGTHSWAVDFTVEDLVAVALRRLKSIADQACGSDVRRAVFGFPLAFPGTEGPEFGRRKGLAWARLEDAARLAGFEEVERLAEPHAAAIVEETESGTVLAVDFGGGTFDVAVIEFTPDSAEVTALQGAAMGGERIDADIFQTKVASALGLDATFSGTSGASLGMPVWMQNRFRSLAGVKHLVANNEVAVWMREHTPRPGGAGLAQLGELLYGGQAYAFYKAIEQAKIELASMEKTTISFHRPGINLDVDFTRTELDDIVSPYLIRVGKCIDRALDQADVSNGSLSYVITTGGSSQLTALQGYLSDRFGADRIKLRDPYNTVVKGLGFQAQGWWGR